MSKRVGSDDRAVVARNIVLLDAAARVVELLARVGVDVLVLKGAALIETVADIHSRRMVDVDFLIHRLDVSRAHDAMLAAGFEWWQPDGRPLATRWHYERAYLGPRRVVCELHTRLAHRFRWPIDHGALFSRAVPLDLAGRATRRLSNEDLLVHVAINAAKDDFTGGARPPNDIASIIAGLPLDWGQVSSVARAWQAQTATWIALEHARRVANALVPVAALDAVAPTRGRRAAIARWLDLDRDDPYRFPEHPGWRRKLIMLAVATDSAWRSGATVGQLAALRAMDAATRLATR